VERVKRNNNQSKIVLITGGTDGIGSQAALMFAQNGYYVIIHGKDIKKGNKTKEDIIQKTNNQNITYYNGDFISFSEIKQFSEKVHKQYFRIDILVNNAGIYENEKVILGNGIEKNFMVNYLASFYLTLNLLDLIKKAPCGRIINVSSMIHGSDIDFDNLNAEKYYSGENAYSQTKLCNILFTYQLSDILINENITVNALHPGVINTKLLRSGWGSFGNSPIEGAKRIFYLASSKEVRNTSGKYFINDQPTKSTSISYDKSVKNRLWELSLKYIKQG